MGKPDILEKVLGGLSIVLIVLMAGSVVLQVTGRHFLADPPAWTEEFGRYIIVWLVAIGAGLNIKQQGYRGAIEFISEALPKLAGRLVRIAFMLLIVGFLVVLAFTSWDSVQRNFDVRTSALELPLAYVYLAIFVMAVLMTVGILYHLAGEVRALAREEPPSADHRPDQDG